jgi:hypothetical protein
MNFNLIKNLFINKTTVDNPKLQYTIDKIIDVFQLIELNNNCWIAGGSICDTYHGIIPKDYDIFFDKKENAIKAYKNFIKKFPNALIVNEDYHKASVKLNNITYEFVFKTNFSPKDTIKEFDFTICQAAIDSKGKLFCEKEFLKDIESKKIKISNDYNLSVKYFIKRLQRYVKKGYHVQHNYIDITKYLYNQIGHNQIGYDYVDYTSCLFLIYSSIRDANHGIIWDVNSLDKNINKIYRNNTISTGSSFY